MAKTRKNKSKTKVKYDKFGNILFVSHNKYMAIRLVDKEIKPSAIRKKRLTRKKKELLPYIEEEYKNRLKKLLKIKSNLNTFNGMNKKKIKLSSVDKFVDKLSSKKTEDYYLKLLKKIKASKK